MKIPKYYFSVQKLAFLKIGIDTVICHSNFIIIYPLVTYGFTFISFIHFLMVAHYTCIHISEFEKATDAMPMLCQLVLTIWKLFIFLFKRQKINLLLKEINSMNFEAQDEMFLVYRENQKDYFLCSLYLKFVIVTGSAAILHPILFGIYIFLETGEFPFIEPNKASYFWHYKNVMGYLLLSIWNGVSVYYTCVVSLAIDTLFSWFVSNITAQFHIISKRFEKVADKCCNTEKWGQYVFLEELISCIQQHRMALQMAENLNSVYGEIIFIKFIIVCTEICSLVFRVSRPNDSLAEVAYKCLFLGAVSLQLILYCYNGQRIKDESFQITTAIYSAFDWSNLPKNFKKLLLISLMRSQKYNNVTGVFFEVDLNLFVWVFRTAGSLITALKALDENPD